MQTQQHRERVGSLGHILQSVQLTIASQTSALMNLLASFQEQFEALPARDMMAGRVPEPLNDKGLNATNARTVQEYPLIAL